MEDPIWFKVKHRELSYSSSLDISLDSKWQELIFLLATLGNHHPYLDDVHILKKMVELKQIENFFYIYILIKPNFSEESLFENLSSLGTLNSWTLTFEDFLTSIKKIYWSLLAPLNLGPVNLKPGAFFNRDLDQLVQILNTDNELTKFKIIIQRKSQKKIWKSKTWHEAVKELIDFYKGVKFPSSLMEYRKNPEFFKNIVYQWWPDLLATLAPFSKEEENIIKEAHEFLAEKGSINFVKEYIKIFNWKIGGELAEQIIKLTYSSPEKDEIRLINHFDKNPSDILYAGFQVKLPKTGIQKFVTDVKQYGFELVLIKNLERLWQPILAEINNINGKIQNIDLLATSEPFWYYLPKDILIHEEDGNYYFFLKSEIESFPIIDGMICNPFTRAKICQVGTFKIEASQSLEEFWSKILRRSIDLSKFTLNSE